VRRKEKSMGVVFSLLSWVLAISMVVALFRIGAATDELTYDDVFRFADIHGVITDRTGQIIYNGQVTDFKAYANTIGHGNFMHNTVLYRHAAKLVPGSVNSLTGYRTVEGEPRQMKTTLLPQEDQLHLISQFKDRKGCCFAFNYETGEIYTMITLPHFAPDQENAAYINRCVDSLYTPGSTMKLIATIVAADQKIKLKDLSYTCNGSFQLPDGSKINCPTSHGKLVFDEALGKSCNGFFAYLITQFDVEKAIETLEELGFEVNENDHEKTEMDGLTRPNSSTVFANTKRFDDVWALIGQGQSQVSPVSMAMIAGAVANGGKVAEPYLISSVENPNKNKVTYEAERDTEKLLSASTASTVKKNWYSGTREYDYTYYKIGLDETVTYAKTGTSEVGDTSENSLLVGVIEEAKTAFYIIVEDSKGSGVSTFTIANELAKVVPRAK